MRNLKVFIPLLICLVFFAACSGLQEKWNALTPDEKARIVLNDFQGQLNNLFDQGKAYVTAKPEYGPLWKEKIVPSFDQANKAIKTTSDLMKTKPLTPAYIYETINSRIVEIVSYLVRIGAIKDS